MDAINLEVKKAYEAKIRQSNYVASLRLEGFKATLAGGEKGLPLREEVWTVFTTNRT